MRLEKEMGWDSRCLRADRTGEAGRQQLFHGEYLGQIRGVPW